MRGRKDRELAFEQKYNVNLTADADATWSNDEIDEMDAAFSQLPEDHVRGSNMVPNIVRRHDEKGVTEGGDYEAIARVPDTESRINMHTGGHHQPGEGVGQTRSPMVDPQLVREHGTNVDSFEYAATHEMGHRWADQHPDVFQKFETIAGYKQVDRKYLEAKAHLSPDAIDELDSRQRGSTQDAWMGKEIEQGNKRYTSRHLAKGVYEEVDKTAFPTDTHGKDDRTDKWWYGRWNSDEHFAELYAKAVHVPEAVYGDFVAGPQQEVAEARSEIARAQHELAHANGDNHAALEAKLDEAQKKANDAVRRAKQLGDEFRLMRNDVFHTDTAAKDAEARLRGRGASEDQLRAFEQDAARASTPAQVEALEHKVR